MVAVPSFVRSNARRGLDLLEFAGDGLRPATVREARQMAGGNISADKVMRMAAWLARHESDLASPKADAYLNGTRERPTAGQVAWLLWGGDIGKANRDRARLWAERTRDRLIEEGELDKATAGAVRVGTTVQFAVPKPPEATQFATGVVESVVRDGVVTVGSDRLDATASDPVARVRVYAKVGDDEYERTDRIVPKNVSELRVVDSIEDKLRKQVRASVRQVLSRKVTDHNTAHGSTAGKRVTLSMLQQVFERGIGAYEGNPGSVRPTVTSAEQWAYARVNAFLTAVRTGKYPRTAFDTDLLPSGHPLSTKSTTKETPTMDFTKATKREDGEDFPAQAFAYVPDAEMPSTWKLRLWDSLDDRETAAQVGRAVAALGAGFRGQRVEIPADALARVKARVLQAWLKVNPDMTRDDAPNVLKGYGYEMKDDDEMGDDYEMEYDPLRSLLDAYATAVRLAPTYDDLLEPIMALVPELRSLYSMEGGMSPMGMRREYTQWKSQANKGHGYKTPMSCLLDTYQALLMFPDAKELRDKVMALIHQADSLMFSAPMPDDDAEIEVEDGMGMGRRRTRVMREIKQEGGQYCVYSQTGRQFGCYTSLTGAQDRLAQIERFSNAKLASATFADLVSWHNACHATKVVTPALKLVHDLIEDELAGNGIAEPYDMSTAEKVDLLVNRSAGLVAKADEKRYTLGPWYVPNMEDAHGEFTDPDTLQNALWDWVKAGDRTIYLQHTDKAAGEMVEILTVPFPVEADLTVPGQGTTRHKFPANTPFMGVVWQPWAWDQVKQGNVRGYSIGGTAQRMEAQLPDAALI